MFNYQVTGLASNMNLASNNFNIKITTDNIGFLKLVFDLGEREEHKMVNDMDDDDFPF